jgi:hypothetical protein
MTLTRLLRHRVSKVIGVGLTIATAGILAFGGLVPVGALDPGTYDCGTYGGATYNNGDCTAATSSSSTPGSSSTGTSTTSGQIVLNDSAEYTSSAGKSLTLKKGDVLYFNLAGEKHTITVKVFDANTLIVTIASTPTDVAVPMGQTTNYDVDQDGNPDIAITYSQIASDNGSVTAVFRALQVSTSPTSTNASASGSSTGGTTTGPVKSANLWWVWLIPIVIGIILLIWAIMVAKKRRNANNATTGTTFRY